MIPRAAHFALLALGCSRTAGTSPSGTPNPSAPPQAIASAPAPTESAPAPPPASLFVTPVTACRALQVKGAVTLASGTRLDSGAALDRSQWVDLAPGSALVVEHAATSRELTFTGKGHVLPCSHGEERFLMTDGTVTTAPGTGARPGAEVLLATPLGLLRYGDAELTATLDGRGLRVAVKVGSAFFDAPGDQNVGRRINAGSHFTEPAARPDVKGLVHTCEASADVAAERARDVLSPKPPAAPLGVRAAAHVRARQAARNACAIAEAAVGALEMGKDRDDLGQVLGAADAKWRGVPD